jgi:hypothetical protein
MKCGIEMRLTIQWLVRDRPTLRGRLPGRKGRATGDGFRGTCRALSLLIMLPIGIIGGMTHADPGPLDELALPPVEKQPWRFDGFPIIGWWGPPGTATLEDFEAYRDAGFTIHATNPDEGFDQAMEFVRAAELKSMPFRQLQGFALPAKQVDYEPHMDVIVGWLTHDEPGGYGAVIEAIMAVNELMRQDPTRWALFNMLPPGAQRDPGTRAVIDAAVRHGMPILSYDHYYIHADGTDNEQWQAEWLDLFRTASLEHEVPFWAFALTTQHFNYRRPSESDLRWMQYTNLAYGAKGLWYFCYWGPHGWENWDDVSIVDPSDGSKTELYEQVKALNHAVLEMGDVLLRLRNVDVFHTNPPAGQRELPEDQFWIARAEGTDVLVSFFEHDDGSQYAMVVNKRHGMGKSAAELAEEIELRFADEVRAVEVVNWLDGEPGELAIEQGRVRLTVHGGTGVLLKKE